MRSTAAFGRLEQFHLEPELDIGRAVQRPDAARPFLRRASRDGQDGNRFIVNIPERGYCFVASVDMSAHEN